MKRFALGLLLGACTGAITSAAGLAEPWWLLAGAVAACLVWFGRYALERLVNAINRLASALERRRR